MQYSGRSGCAFTPAFGREERRFRGGFLERPKAEALGYLEASATTTATAKASATATAKASATATAKASATATAKTGWVIVYIPTLGAIRPRQRWGTPCSRLFERTSNYNSNNNESE